MPRNAIKASLLELKENLKDVAASGVFPDIEELDSRLGLIIDDIEDSSDDSLKEGIGSIQASVSGLELSHPKITSTLNQIMNMLSSLGI